jgi:hypothetical protein
MSLYNVGKEISMETNEKDTVNISNEEIMAERARVATKQQNMEEPGPKFAKAHKGATEAQVMAERERIAARQQDMIANFQWTDDAEEGTEIQPELTTDQMLDAVDKVVRYCVANLDISHYDEMTWSLGMTVPQAVHEVIQNRFNNVWTLESRFEQFDSLKSLFADRCMTSPFKDELDKKLNELFPTESEFSHENPANEWEINSASIEDEEDCISVGIIGDESESSESGVYVSFGISKCPTP